MNMQDMLQWWNVIYLAPLAVSIIWIVATAVGGLHAGTGHVDAGHDFGHDVGHDIGHDIGHDAGHDIGHDTGHEHDVHHPDHYAHHDQDSGLAQRLLDLLGFGQAPISLLLGILMFCWGACGMAINQVFESSGIQPLVYILPSLLITFVASFVLTRIMAALIARMLPKEESFGVTRRELVGSVGKAVYTISAEGGTVDIQDKYGTVHRAQAKTARGEKLIPSDAEVLVVDYDVSDCKFVVKGEVWNVDSP